MTTNATPIRFERAAKVLKVDESLGLVFGWAIVSTEDGEPYFDKNDPPDHIPDESMLATATDFSLNSSVMKEMHRGEQVGTVVFSFPLTAEIAKAFGLETKRTGWMIAVKPGPDILAKFVDGTYTGFSIGGFRGEDEEVFE